MELQEQILSEIEAGTRNAGQGEMGR